MMVSSDTCIVSPPYFLIQGLNLLWKVLFNLHDQARTEHRCHFPNTGIGKLVQHMGTPLTISRAEHLYSFLYLSLLDYSVTTSVYCKG